MIYCFAKLEYMISVAETNHYFHFYICQISFLLFIGYLLSKRAIIFIDTQIYTM